MDLGSNMTKAKWSRLFAGFLKVLYQILDEVSSSIPLLGEVCLHLSKLPRRVDYDGEEISFCSLAKRLLLLLTALLEEVVRSLGLVHEIGVIAEQSLEIDSLLVEKHTGDDWGGLIAEGSLDGSIDAISYEGLSLFA